MQDSNPLSKTIPSWSRSAEATNLSSNCPTAPLNQNYFSSAQLNVDWACLHTLAKRSNAEITPSVAECQLPRQQHNTTQLRLQPDTVAYYFVLLLFQQKQQEQGQSNGGTRAVLSWHWLLLILLYKPNQAAIN